MNKQLTLSRAGKIIREVAPRIHLTDRRIFRLPQLSRMNGIWQFWVAFATIEPHTDQDTSGNVTRGLIILNDHNMDLFVDAPDRTYWSFGPGDAYRLLPEITHGLCTKEHTFIHKTPAEYDSRMFAAMIRTYSVSEDPSTYDEFVDEAFVALSGWSDIAETSVDEIAAWYTDEWVKTRGVNCWGDYSGL